MPFNYIFCDFTVTTISATAAAVILIG